jgi:hypothetical protein
MLRQANKAKVFFETPQGFYLRENVELARQPRLGKRNLIVQLVWLEYKAVDNEQFTSERVFHPLGRLCSSNRRESNKNSKQIQSWSVLSIL